MDAKKGQIKKLLGDTPNSLTERDLLAICQITEGYSSADLNSVVKEAGMAPVRDLKPEQLLTIQKDQLRKINFKDFQKACQVIAPSVSKKSIKEYADWHKSMGNN